MASIEKLVTNRENPGLIVDGFKFRKDNIFKNSKLWRCVEKTCSSRCKTDLDDLIMLYGRLEYDHAEPDRRNIERQRVRQACKRKAEDVSSEKPSKFIIKEIEKIGVNELVTQDITSVRQACTDREEKYNPSCPLQERKQLKHWRNMKLSQVMEKTWCMLVVQKQRLLCLQRNLIYSSCVKMMYQCLVMEHSNIVPNFSISYILFMPSRMDSMYHVCFSFFHAKTKNAILQSFNVSWIFVLRKI